MFPARQQIVGIYFSAHWCGPCRSFTPKLVAMYEELKAGGKKFEVIFVSSDKDQDAFDKYFGSMPWLALPFEDRDLKVFLPSEAPGMSFPPWRSWGLGRAWRLGWGSRA
eukprot:3434805-Rhodomonas_salina.2